ncbi:Uncharacterised protein [Chromobacterium violaceum]|uniref:Uncharacterized protein n=1 Tax=Chromobacterium violaceum TaxID=536 RepID=A0A447TFU1_CHRVL|nr:Uncharacterised protein [Chromobacterium violaceum]
MRQMALLRPALMLSLSLACADARAASMTVDSLDGPVTRNEIQSFVDFAQELQPGASNAGNEWAQGRSGENLKAMALVYDIAPSQPCWTRWCPSATRCCRNATTSCRPQLASE